jgi:hypothetical protein
MATIEAMRERAEAALTAPSETEWRNYVSCVSPRKILALIACAEILEDCLVFHIDDYRVRDKARKALAALDAAP